MLEVTDGLTIRSDKRFSETSWPLDGLRFLGREQRDVKLLIELPGGLGIVRRLSCE